MSSLGELLRLYRAKYKIQQIDLAHALKLSTCFISQIENERAIPSVTTMEKIAAYFGISLGIVQIISCALPNELCEKRKEDFKQLQHELIQYALKTREDRYGTQV